MRNGEALVAWVASGNAKVVPEPKRKWKSNEVSKLKAPWCEANLTHSETNGPTLGSRFRLKLTKEEAEELNSARLKITKAKRERKMSTNAEIEVELSW